MSLDVSLCEARECPHCHGPVSSGYRLFDQNITHNLNDMAEAAGIYMHLWRPDEMVPPIATAAQLIDPLADALALLLREPDRFRPLSPKNGWGSYEGLLEFVSSYLRACRENPTAIVEVSR